ncbi:hypothetical protein AAVH_02902 [Aphelenchoides avenae]|nr:hypothetical protein AAVH_02902 [Aphelenchus avenae]
MGANMGKSSHYNYYHCGPRRKALTDNGNHFNKDYWEKAGAAAGITRPEYWMVGSERQYRQEVFNRESDNFYQSPASYRTQSTFESPFSTKPSQGESKGPASGGWKEPTSSLSSATSSGSSKSLTSAHCIRPVAPKYLPSGTRIC